MRVEVTAEDIAAGRPGSHRSCPVANALRRATGCIWWVDGYFAENPARGSLRLPDEVAGFVSHFDSGRAVEPFTFEIGDAP